MTGDTVVTVDVLEGYLVCIDGKQTGGRVTVPAEVAEQWQRAGWATPTVMPARTRKRTP